MKLVKWIKGNKKNTRGSKEVEGLTAVIVSITDSGMRIEEDPVVDFLIELQNYRGEIRSLEIQQRISLLHLADYQPGRIVKVKMTKDDRELQIVGPK